MFAVIYIPNFSLQAVLRHEPELQASPVVLLEGKSPKAIIIQTTASARALSIEEGMTPTQAMARCEKVLIKTRSLAQESAAAEVVVQSALSFSPYVETTGLGVCTLDLREQKNVGDEAFAKRIIGQLEKFYLRAQVGIARSPDLAWLAAQSAGSFQVMQDPTEFLSKLPVESLSPPMEILNILKRWGITTVGGFLALGKEKVSERLGAESLELFARASAESIRPLKLMTPPESYKESFEFQNEVESIEPLLFILRRFLSQICQRLELAHLVVQDMKLCLTFSDAREAQENERESQNLELFESEVFRNDSISSSSESYEHTLRVPSPTCDVDVLFRMLHTHLEQLRADSPVSGVSLSVTPSQPSFHQFHLFEAALRDPNHFFETIGRLTALLGPDRVGIPVLELTHRPDAFQIRPVSTDTSASTVKPGSEEKSIFSGLAIRRCRPPLPASVHLEQGKPNYVSSTRWKGKIHQVQGPWKSSGNWWDKEVWEREEWDIQMTNGRMLRLVHQKEAWFIEGIYD